MLITGLAMPYMAAATDDAQVAVFGDGSLRGVRPAQPVRWARGAFMPILSGQGYAEVVVNHAWREHLASTRHGLFLFETLAGLYFHARFPETTYAQAVYRAVAEGKIQHVCTLSTHTEGDDEGGVLTIRRAELVGINLLIAATAHQPATWVQPAGDEAEHRIQVEADTAQSRALWALDVKVTASMVAQELGQ